MSFCIRSHIPGITSAHDRTNACVSRDEAVINRTSIPFGCKVTHAPSLVGHDVSGGASDFRHPIVGLRSFRKVLLMSLAEAVEFDAKTVVGHGVILFLGCASLVVEGFDLYPPRDQRYWECLV
jgi:hypothetical protein